VAVFEFASASCYEFEIGLAGAEIMDSWKFLRGKAI
jgi:hypothetical protein